MRLDNSSTAKLPNILVVAILVISLLIIITLYPQEGTTVAQAQTPDEVATSKNIDLSKGHRAVFRNPRGQQDYYVFYQNLVPTIFYYSWSADGDTWNEVNPSISAGWSYDIKIREDEGGSQLIVYMAMHRGSNINYYRGTIADASDTITWGVQDLITTTNATLSGRWDTAIARTDSGRLVIVYVDDITVATEDYRQVKIVGSDDDSANPTWSDITVIDDPSGDVDNDLKDEVYVAIEAFDSTYPDRTLIVWRSPNGVSTTSYRMGSANPEWDGSSFTGTGATYNGAGSNVANTISLIIDTSDFAHVMVQDQDHFSSTKASTAGDHDFTGNFAIVVSSTVMDAGTLTIDTSATPDVLYTFYHDPGDTTDFHYKIVEVDDTPHVWGTEQTITYAQDVTALSSAERDQVNSVHVVGVRATNVVFYLELTLAAKPELTNSGLDPASGDTSTNFNFTIDYSHTAGTPANVVKVNVSDAPNSTYNNFTMAPTEDPDINYFVQENWTINGTIDNFANAQSDSDGGAYANLVQENTTIPGDTWQNQRDPTACEVWYNNWTTCNNAYSSNDIYAYANGTGGGGGGVQLPSVKDTITSDTTTSTTFEDVDGLTVDLTVDDQSDILLLASIQATGSTSAEGGWRLVFDGTNYLQSLRQVNSEPGNILITDLVVGKTAGTYTFKLQHQVASGTLWTNNTIIVAVSLHNGNGGVPANSSYVASDTVGNAWEDIPGLTADVTLSKTSHIWALMVFHGYHSGANKRGTFAINIDATRMEEDDRDWEAANTHGAVSLVTRTASEKTAGTYTVKGEWTGMGGTTLTGEDFKLVVIAAEADSGSVGIDIQKDIVTSDTTTATALEDITGLSVSAVLGNTAHVLSVMTMSTDVSVSGASAYSTISIDATDYDVMERGHAAQNRKGNIGQLVRTDTALSSGSKTVNGRWYTDSANTLTGDDIVLTTIVLRDDASPATPGKNDTMWQAFGFTLNATDTVLAVEVGVEWYRTTIEPILNVTITWDGGTSWATNETATNKSSDDDTLEYFNFTTATTWDDSTLNDGNLEARAGTNMSDARIDHIVVRVKFVTEGTEQSIMLVGFNTTSIRSTGEDILRIRYNMTISGDTFQVWVYNFTTPDWENEGLLDQTAVSWLNVTLEAGDKSSGEVRIRFNDTSDTAWSNLSIDYQLVNNTLWKSGAEYYKNTTLAVGWYTHFFWANDTNEVANWTSGITGPSVTSAGDCQDLTVVVNNVAGQMYFNATTDDPTGGLWQEENVSADFQTTSTPALNVTNDDIGGACDVTLELLTSPGSGRTMKFSLANAAPNPGVNSVPVGSNVTAVTGLGSGSTQSIWLWIDLADSQGGSVSPSLRVDTEV